MKISNDNIQNIINKLKENTKTEVIKIRTKLSDEQLPILCSKFGGVPYWPNNRIDYPKTNAGIPLTMLAQINLSDLPKNEAFPDKGLLQFYIWNLEDWDNYQVVFHKDCDIPIHPAVSSLPTSLMEESVTITWVGKAHTVVTNPFWGDSGMFPIGGEMRLEFYKDYESVSITENCFESEVIKAVKQLGIDTSDDFNAYTDFPKECYNEFCEFGGGHKLLGRPYFVQYDYREDDNKDILLFQMDSAWHDTGETDEHNFINFGDAGTAGFFIDPDALKKYDFSKVYYDWQCG